MASKQLLTERVTRRDPPTLNPNTIYQTCDSNFVAYWGQNSYGAANPNNQAGWQQRLSAYCQDSSIDVIPIAFLDVFSSTGGLPVINLANTCNDV